MLEVHQVLKQVKNLLCIAEINTSSLRTGDDHITNLNGHLDLQPCLRVIKLTITTNLDVGHHLNGFSVFIDFHRYHK